MGDDFWNMNFKSLNPQNGIQGLDINQYLGKGKGNNFLMPANSGGAGIGLNGEGASALDASAMFGGGDAAGGGFNLTDIFGGGNLGGTLEGLGALATAWNGMNQLSLAEDEFDFTKASTNRNLANQAKLINSQMADRQNARNASTGASGSTGYQSTSGYVADNAVDGSRIR